MTSLTQIVHKLNELIADVETAHQSLLTNEPAAESLKVHNQYKRAIGQLKAARASLIATGELGRAA